MNQPYFKNLHELKNLTKAEKQEQGRTSRYQVQLLDLILTHSRDCIRFRSKPTSVKFFCNIGMKLRVRNPWQDHFQSRFFRTTQEHQWGSRLIHLEVPAGSMLFPSNPFLNHGGIPGGCKAVSQDLIISQSRGSKI